MNNINIWSIILLGLLFTGCNKSLQEIGNQNEQSTTQDDTSDFSPSLLPKLHVEDRYLKNEKGETVNLHGVTQTYSPFFNQNAWNNYDVDACLAYNQAQIDGVLAAGWQIDFVRVHMDPYWSNDPSLTPGRYEGIAQFSVERFKLYLERVFIPMIKYINSKGLYVILRPPGVCPEKIAVGDKYNKYLELVWGIVSKDPIIKNNPGVMFELANEPIDILGADGSYGASGQQYFDNAKEYFQRIVDTIRNNEANNIIWVPGLAYQSSYAGYATKPIIGKNIGYAVHAYPGWYGSDAEQPSNELGGGFGGGYRNFQLGWNDQVKPVADIAPIVVTEMDWAPAKYDASWGKGITGTVGGSGFGANFKYIADISGNVSWLVFTDIYKLTKFKNTSEASGSYNFLNDPEACPWPIYHWFENYASKEVYEDENMKLIGIKAEGMDAEESLTMLTGTSSYLIVKAMFDSGDSLFVTSSAKYSSSNESAIIVSKTGEIKAVGDGNAEIEISYTASSGSTANKTYKISSSTFPLTAEKFNPSIWEDGTFDENTKTLITGTYGFGGWEYENGLDISKYKYLVAQINGNNPELEFRIFDTNNYFSQPASYSFKNSNNVIIQIDDMYKTINEKPQKLDPTHIYIVGFWSPGGKKIRIDSVYLTNEYP